MGIRDTGPTRVAKWVWESYGIPPPIEEYRFTKSRKWRFDFAWVPDKVALEVSGGAYIRGRHVRGRGFERDAEKFSCAAAHGWRILICTPGQLKSGEIFGFIRQALGLEAITDGAD